MVEKKRVVDSSKHHGRGHRDEGKNLRKKQTLPHLQGKAHRRQEVHIRPSQRLEACTAFKSLSPVARVRMVQDTDGCEVCTAGNHRTRRCNFSNDRPPAGRHFKCPARIANQECGVSHHPILHKTGGVLDATVPFAPRPDLLKGSLPVAQETGNNHELDS